MPTAASRRRDAATWVCGSCAQSNHANAAKCSLCGLNHVTTAAGARKASGGTARSAPIDKNRIDKNRIGWQNMRASTNVQDRRGQRSSPQTKIPLGPAGAGVLLVIGVVALMAGVDPQTIIQGAQMLAQQQQQHPARGTAAHTQSTPQSDDSGRFVAAILGETEDVWRATLPEQAGVRYQDPQLVMFRGSTQSACGFARSAMGPFYCPADRTVYLDTAFFDDMRAKYGGGGNFAYAYVIGHEVAHHVENLLGVLDQLERAHGDRNAASVAVELTADCLAGVWAGQMQNRRHNLQEADVAQAIATASSIGDDRLQMESRGYVVPDSFTHGSAEQRVRAFLLGFRGRSVQRCIDRAPHV